MSSHGNWLCRICFGLDIVHTFLTRQRWRHRVNTLLEEYPPHSFCVHVVPPQNTHCTFSPTRRHGSNGNNRYQQQYDAASRRHSCKNYSSYCSVRRGFLRYLWMVSVATVFVLCDATVRWLSFAIRCVLSVLDSTATFRAQDQGKIALTLRRSYNRSNAKNRIITWNVHVTEL